MMAELVAIADGVATFGSLQEMFSGKPMLVLDERSGRRVLSTNVPRPGGVVPPLDPRCAIDDTLPWQCS